MESSAVPSYSAQMQVTNHSFSSYQPPVDKVDGVFESERAVDSVYYPSVSVSGPVGAVGAVGTAGTVGTVGAVGPMPSGLAQLPLPSALQHAEGYHYNEQVALYPNSTAYVDMNGNQQSPIITYTV